MAHWEKHEYQSGGIHSWYITAGMGEPLVFIHGLGVTPFTYEEVLSALASSYTIFCLQVPPFGTSGSPKEIWDFSHYATYFESFLKDQALSSVYLAGHSYGGGIAMAVAATSKRIKKLILINPVGAPLSIRRRKLIAQVFARSLWWSLLGKPTLKADIIIHFLQSIAIHVFHFHRIFFIIDKSLRRQTTDFHAIAAPTLILWGKEDELLPLEHAAFLAHAIPHARVIYSDGYHNWCFFHPDRVAQLVEDFTNGGN